MEQNAVWRLSVGPQQLLNCYSHKIRLDQSLLLKQHTAGVGGGNC
jgi:hypothetical protein